MKTLNLNFKRSIYRLNNQNDEGTIKDYLLLKIEDEGSKYFTEKIRIEKDNGYHKRSRNFEEWLYLRDESNWKRCTKSGLAFTGCDYILEGNIPSYVELPMSNQTLEKIPNPKHLIIVQFSQDFRYIVLDIFEGFYPYKRGLIQYIISEHGFYFEKFRKGA